MSRPGSGVRGQLRRAAAGLSAGIVAVALTGCGREALAPTTATAPASAADAEASAVGPTWPTAPLVPPVAAALPTDDQRRAGATLAGQGAAGAAACSSCHGAQGEGNPAGLFPRLAGQPYAYLLHQLDSYADGSREHAVMTPIAKALSAEQRRAAAAHYAALAPAAPAVAANRAAPRTAGSGGAAARNLSTPGGAGRGALLASVGDEARLVQACANCHGPDGVGEPPTMPYLAGQHAGYLAAALAAWRDGSRQSDPSGQMPLIAKALSEADVQALSAFYASLPPPVLALDTPGMAQDRAPGPASGPTPGSVLSGPRPAASTPVAAGTAVPRPTGQGTESGTPFMGGQGPGGGGTNSTAPGTRSASSP